MVYTGGLFRAWAWVNMDIAVLVYPQPADTSTVPDRMPDPRNTGGQQQIGEEEFSGLREFRPGDSPRRVAWKSFARLGTLLVKEYREGGQTPLWIDWDAIAAPDIETRLSILTRLVLDANREHMTFGLRLPGSSFGPQSDHAHLHRCLRQLATFGLSGNRTAEPPPRRGRP